MRGSGFGKCLTRISISGSPEQGVELIPAGDLGASFVIEEADIIGMAPLPQEHGITLPQGGVRMINMGGLRTHAVEFDHSDVTPAAEVLIAGTFQVKSAKEKAFEVPGDPFDLIEESLGYQLFAVEKK